MDLTIIEELRDSTNIKLIQRYCNRILKKLSFRSKRDLDNVSLLIDVLYICDYYPEAISVLGILSGIEFTGNELLWDDVVSSRAVVMKIHQELGNTEEAEKHFGLISPYLSPELYENLKGFVMESYKKDELVAIKYGWKSDIRDAKIMQLEKKIYFSVIPDFPIDKVELEKEIQELKAELKPLIKLNFGDRRSGI